MKLINKLVAEKGFALLSWSDRYGKGVWVCVAPRSADLGEIESATEFGDLDMFPSTEYLLSQKWLPFALGVDFNDGLNELESRLSRIPFDELERHSEWAKAVEVAIEHFIEIVDECCDYGGMEGKFMVLPDNYKILCKNT